MIFFIRLVRCMPLIAPTKPQSEWSSQGKARVLGYDCTWLSAKEAADRSAALNPESLLGALWSPVELTVDPRLVIGQLPTFLAERYGVEFHLNTAAQEVAIPVLTGGRKTWRAKTVVLAAGDDFQTLFPETLAGFGLSRCKLQMMRTVIQSAGWQLGPSLAFGRLRNRAILARGLCQTC